MKMIPKSFVCLLTLLLVGVGSSARADRCAVLAADNATVQPAGPRPGDNGKRFFNLEGNGADIFSSFGVADFYFPEHEAVLETLTLTLVQSNAAFTADGLLHFWLTTDTTTDIQPGEDPAVRFIPEDNPDGLDQQLVPRFFLGSGMFVLGDSGQADSYTFSLSTEARQYLLNQIHSGGTVRIVVSPADSVVAATYAGYTHADFNGPVLTVDFGA